MAAVGEVDAYSALVAGVRLEAVRTGLGAGPHRVLSLNDDRFLYTANDIGFPFRSTATIGDEQVVVAVIIDAPPGSKWCSIDLEPGTVLAYGPGAEHTASNLAGARVAFAFADLEQLDGLADQHQATARIPPRGEVQLVARSAKAQAITSSFSALSRADERLPGQLDQQCDEVARALMLALSDQRPAKRIGRGKAMDSRRIVHVCIDLAHAMERIPSISEMCLAAHVSERRLREAFVREFSQPPSRYFRDWALQHARLRLLRGEPPHVTVTGTAQDLGMFHLGRFAGHYRALFGEKPSVTLQTNARRLA